jgi:hypothetical protein
VIGGSVCRERAHGPVLGVDAKLEPLEGIKLF